MNELKEIQNNIKKASVYSKKYLEKLLTFELKIDLKKEFAYDKRLGIEDIKVYPYFLDFKKLDNIYIKVEISNYLKQLLKQFEDINTNVYIDILSYIEDNIEEYINKINDNFNVYEKSMSVNSDLSKITMNFELENTLYMEKIDKNNIYIFDDINLYEDTYDLYYDYISKT